MDEVESIGEENEPFLLRERVFLFIKVYWKTLCLINIPIIFCPLIIMHETNDFKCLYILIIMAFFWALKILPLPVTGMFPIVLFPIMGIMDSKETCDAYMREAMIMFLASLMMALGVQHSRLPKRLALKFIQIIGFSHFKLIYAFSFVTMIFSMWLSNSAVISMLAPIIMAVLEALDENAMGDAFEKVPVRTDASYLSWTTFESYKTALSGSETEVNVEKIASKTTMCYFVTVVYSSSIGSMATVIGTPTNLVYEGILLSRFPGIPDIPPFLLFTIVPVLMMHTLIFLYMLYHFMGWLRPNSEDAKRAYLNGRGNRKIMKCVIDSHYAALGPMTVFEKAAIAALILTGLLFIFRSPKTIKGWGDYAGDYKYIGTSCVTTTIVLLMTLIPLSTDFLCFWDPKKGIKDFPTKEPRGMLTWKYVSKRIYWELIFLIGGSFALSKGIYDTGLGLIISESFECLQAIPLVAVLAILVFSTELLTTFCSDVTVANIIFPIIAEMATALRCNPVKLMLPAALACSFTLRQLIGTPPMAIVNKHVSIPVRTEIIASIGPLIICGFSIIITTLYYWPSIYPDIDTFPLWAWENDYDSLLST